MTEGRNLQACPTRSEQGLQSCLAKQAKYGMSKLQPVRIGFSRPRIYLVSYTGLIFLSTAYLKSSQQLQQFAIAYVLAFHAKITTDKQSIQEFSYQSPIISRDIYVLSETFLL